MSQRHRHPISGFTFQYSQGTVSWSSKKQAIIALSSTEAEYVVQIHAAKEAMWLKTFINEIRGGQEGPLTIMADNQSTIALAKDNKFHSRTKDMDLQYHFICEAIRDKRIKMQYILTMDNVADIFTKALPKLKFVNLLESWVWPL